MAISKTFLKQHGTVPKPSVFVEGYSAGCIVNGQEVFFLASNVESLEKVFNHMNTPHMLDRSRVQHVAIVDFNSIEAKE